MLPDYSPVDRTLERRLALLTRITFRSIADAQFLRPASEKGGLAYLTRRLLLERWQLPALLAALVLVLTVRVSRLFLRVHFASDVMADFAAIQSWKPTTRTIPSSTSRYHVGRLAS